MNYAVKIKKISDTRVPTLDNLIWNGPNGISNNQNILLKFLIYFTFTL